MTNQEYDHKYEIKKLHVVYSSAIAGLVLVAIMFLYIHQPQYYKYMVRANGTVLVREMAKGASYALPPAKTPLARCTELTHEDMVALTDGVLVINAERDGTYSCVVENSSEQNGPYRRTTVYRVSRSL